MPSAPVTSSAAWPASGDLRETSLPSLMLDLYRGRFSGRLGLSRGHVEKALQFHEGAPVSSESSVASESLCALLGEQGALTSDDAARVSATVKQRGCSEAVALLQLKIVQPKALFVALRSLLRKRVVDCFGWPDGAFALEADDTVQEDAQAFRVDPYRLVQAGLIAHWSSDRLIADVSQHLDRYPHPGPALASASARLERDATTEALLASLDGTRTTAQIVQTAIGSPTALATLWLLERARLLDLRLSPEQSRAESIEAKLGGDLEIEVEIRGTAPVSPPAEAGMRVEIGKRAARTATAGGAEEERTEAMRLEIEEKSGQLDVLDYYGLLGIAADASAVQIKKAYFQAAKRYHPDALARLGLDALKETAGHVFSRIAEAYETLSRPQKRSEYDRSLEDDGPKIDAERLAQAETFYRKGEILIRMGDFRGALEYLEPAVELWPEEAAYQSALGWAFYRKTPPEPESAREHLEQALALAPNDPVHAYRLGTVLRSVGEEKRAAELLARAGPQAGGA